MTFRRDREREREEEREERQAVRLEQQQERQQERERETERPRDREIVDFHHHNDTTTQLTQQFTLSPPLTNLNQPNKVQAPNVNQITRTVNHDTQHNNFSSLLTTKRVHDGESKGFEPNIQKANKIIHDATMKEPPSPPHRVDGQRN